MELKGMLSGGVGSMLYQTDTITVPIRCVNLCEYLLHRNVSSEHVESIS